MGEDAQCILKNDKVLDAAILLLLAELTDLKATK